LADFLFRVSAFGSFAKVSASRRVRAFANVPNQGWTKNMTKPYVRWTLPLLFQVFPPVSTMLLPLPDIFPFVPNILRIMPDFSPCVPNIFLPVSYILRSV